MAVWQFQCNIIPLRENTGRLSYEEMISWQGISLPHPVDFLEREQSWCADIVQYGKLDETCVELIYSNGELEEVVCRLDLRTLTKQTLTLIVEYVQNIDAGFLVGDNVYAPRAEIMAELIKQSKACQYCKDPMGYIASLNPSKQF